MVGNGQTALINYESFDLIVNHDIARARRDGECLTVLCIDLDLDGKSVDPAIFEETAELFSRQIRASDVVAKIGPISLGILLPQTDSLQSLVVIDHLASVLAEAELAAELGGLLTVRIGRASFEPTGPATDFDQLVLAARCDVAPAIISRNN
jgi:diguanylate cyclase (GGDEF)-like protein